MNRIIDRFRRQEDGAVTVDWVVLTAGVILLGLVVTSAVINGATDPATGLGARLDDAVVPEVVIE